MKRMPTNHTQVLACLNHLPRKMVSLQGNKNLPNFVLYDFCHESCFNFPKAAYLVDNPDFDCFKGICGLNKQEKDFCQGITDIWKESDHYCRYIEQSPFNKKVREIARPSISKHNEAYDKVLDAVSHQLGFSKPEYFSWLMKHDNHGYLIVEDAKDLDTYLQEYLKNGIHLLSFCPIA
jgi:hypothetical protein